MSSESASSGRGRPASGRGARASSGRTPAGNRQRSRQAPSQRARSGDPARSVAFATLRAVAEEDAYANLVLPGLVRRARLDSRDAAFATELSYGTLRWRGLYDAIIVECAGRALDAIDPPVLDCLRLGVHQLVSMRVPPHAAVSATVALARSEIGSGPAGFVNAVLRRVGERDLAAWREQVCAGLDATAALAIAESHPAWIVRALRESLVLHGRELSAQADGSDELRALLAADNVAPRVTLLARPGLADVSELVAAGAEAGRWSPYAAVLGGGDPAGVAAVAERRARVQDEGSQLVALALMSAPLGPGMSDGGREADSSDSVWLDLCAGPGGKTALLAALARQRGARVVAVEPAPHRAQLVSSGLLADDPVEVRTRDGRTVGDDEPACYDRVLVDAPCTGLGALRRRPESRWRRQPSDLATLAPLQRDLLASGLRALRPGGVLAYVTCSPHPAETLLVVEDVQRRLPGVRLLDAPAALRAAAGKELPDLGDGPTAQLWPHLHGTDAMFLALFTRD